MKRPLPGQLLTLAFAFAAFSLLALVPKLVTSQSELAYQKRQHACENTSVPRSNHCHLFLMKAR